MDKREQCMVVVWLVSNISYCIPVEMRNVIEGNHTTDDDGSLRWS